MNRSNLKPCPFCGSWVCQTYLAGNSVYVRCNMCNSTSGLADDWEAAVKAWNRRAKESGSDAI